MAASILFTDVGGRVLLVEPTYRDTWLLPGGTVEADESPRTGALREVEEELGLEVVPGQLLVVDWLPTDGEWTESISFTFAGGVLDPALEAKIRLPADELRSWAWCTEAEAEERVSAVLARRLRVAARALQLGSTVYSENGELVG
jgi:8-oxo-dGTP diphosphatase